MSGGVELDSIDLAILRELQGDGRITNVELASRVGISAPPCLRRVRRLEETGIITGYRAMLDAARLGQEIEAFCLIGLLHQSETDIKAFAAMTRDWPMVRAAWMMSRRDGFHPALRGAGLQLVPAVRPGRPYGGGECRHCALGSDHRQGQGRRAGRFVLTRYPPIAGGCGEREVALCARGAPQHQFCLAARGQTFVIGRM